MPAVKPGAQGAIQYIPLVKGDRDRELQRPDLIRVFVIHPGQGDEEVVCSIEIRVMPILDRRGKAIDPHVDGIEDGTLPLMPYVALSYAWEGQTPSKCIKVCYLKDHLPLFVTANLFEAIKSLRDTQKPRNFWADAICMDQNNDTEKSQQLPLMSRIYSEADNVYVWLGKPEDDTPKAFKLMRDLRQWRKFPTIVESTNCDEWVAFAKRMDRPWFDRRWVVQEIVLAGRAELKCGTETIDWLHFAQAVAFFELMEDRVNKKFRNAANYDNPPDMFGDIKEYSASRLVRVTLDVVTHGEGDRVIRKKESLESLLSILTPFETGPGSGHYLRHSITRQRRPRYVC